MAYRFLRHVGLAGVLSLLLGATAFAAPKEPPPEPPLPDVPPGQVAVLTHKQPLSFFISWRWPARGTAAQYTESVPDPKAPRWVRSDYSSPTPLPDPAWIAPDFDDSTWSRQEGPLLGWLGYRRGGASSLNDVALLCARTRFSVADPGKATNVVLHLSYRGGAVVYLNGAEVARGHLPAGKLELLTLAEDYPESQFQVPAPRDDAPPKGQEADYLPRVRELTVTLPARLLRKGANVLAVELHRTAQPEGATQGNSQWATAGLVSLQVTAPEGAGVSGPATPAGAYVWNVDPFVRAGFDVAAGDPLEPLRPLAITGPRNSIVNGQVAVSLPAAGPGVAANIGNLTTAGGDTIPRDAIQIRYVQPEAAVPGLLNIPASTGTVHPIWVTVRIPKTARPGEYRGELTVATPDAPTRVPVVLTVTGWALPDRANWSTDAGFLQSPEAVAGHYGVPLWSDEHFRYLEKSLAVLGYLGTNAMSIGTLAEDIFGADPAIVFVRDGDSWKPDFRYAERYLATYAKYAPAPRVLNIQVWNYSVSGTGVRRDSRGARWIADTLKVLELKDGKLTQVEIPGYTKPGSAETWRQVVTGVRATLDKLGWQNTEIVLGTSGDDWPVPEIITFFKDIDPTMRWRVATHGSSVARWGETDAERTQGNGMVVGWANMVRRITTTRGQSKSYLYTVIKRDSVSDSPADYFTLPPLGKAAGYTGICNRPLDYWTYTPPGGTARCPLSFYVSFGNITPQGPRSFITPGPDGALPTPQVEMLREGMQVAEAVTYIERTLGDQTKAARISKSTAADAQAVISDLRNALEASRRFYPPSSGDPRRLINRLYVLTGTIAVQVGE